MQKYRKGLGHWDIAFPMTSLPHPPSSRSSIKFQLGCTVGHNETAVESKSSPSLPIQGSLSCEAQMFPADSHRLVCWHISMPCTVRRSSGFVPHCTLLRWSQVLDIRGFHVSDVEGTSGAGELGRRRWNPYTHNLLYLDHSLRCSTQCPLWLLPLSATLKCCPSTQNSAGEWAGKWKHG